MMQRDSESFIFLIQLLKVDCKYCKIFITVLLYFLSQPYILLQSLAVLFQHFPATHTTVRNKRQRFITCNLLFVHSICNRSVSILVSKLLHACKWVLTLVVNRTCLDFYSFFCKCMLSNHMCDVIWPMHTEIVFALSRGKFRIDFATKPCDLFIAIGTVLINQYLFP